MVMKTDILFRSCAYALLKLFLQHILCCSQGWKSLRCSKDRWIERIWACGKESSCFILRQTLRRRGALLVSANVVFIFLIHLHFAYNHLLLLQICMGVCLPFQLGETRQTRSWRACWRVTTRLSLPRGWVIDNNKMQRECTQMFLI